MCIYSWFPERELISRLYKTIYMTLLASLSGSIEKLYNRPTGGTGFVQHFNNFNNLSYYLFLFYILICLTAKYIEIYFIFFIELLFYWSILFYCYFKITISFNLVILLLSCLFTYIIFVDIFTKLISRSSEVRKCITSWCKQFQDYKNTYSIE
jgi:hypothetical protein